MSIPKSPIKGLAIFLNSLRDNSKLSREFCVEITPVISCEKSDSPKPRHAVKKEDLESYFAKPGEAHWGC
jgi:hypothetical protein